MKTYTSILGTLALTLLLGLGSPSAFAQQQAPQEAPNIEVSDQEMEAAARAYIRVEDITAEYRAKFEQTQDQERAKEIQQEMRSATDAVIEEEGLNPQRYDQIIRAAQSDDQLRSELLALLEELQSDEDR